MGRNHILKLKPSGFLQSALTVDIWILKTPLGRIWWSCSILGCPTNDINNLNSLPFEPPVYLFTILLCLIWANKTLFYKVWFHIYYCFSHGSPSWAFLIIPSLVSLCFGAIKSEPEGPLSCLFFCLREKIEVWLERGLLQLWRRNSLTLLWDARQSWPRGAYGL